MLIPSTVSRETSKYIFKPNRPICLDASAGLSGNMYNQMKLTINVVRVTRKWPIVSSIIIIPHLHTTLFIKNIVQKWFTSKTIIKSHTVKTKKEHYMYKLLEMKILSGKI